VSDSILVRISLVTRDDRVGQPEQVLVQVQIPDVARAGWRLPVGMYASLVLQPWEDALRDVFLYADRRPLPEPDVQLRAARELVREWLAVDEHRAAMHEAWFAAEARRHPVARKLLAEIFELKEQRERRRLRLVAYEADLLEMRALLSPIGGCRRIPAEVEIHERVVPAVEWLLARAAEADAQRAALAARLRAGQSWQQGRNPALVSEDYLSQRELRAMFGIPLTAPWDDSDEMVVPQTERSYWVAIADALNAAHGAGMPVGIDLDGTLTDHRAWSVVWDRSAGRWAVAGYEDEADGITQRIAPTQALQPEPDAPALTIHRAQWDSMPLGLYTTPDAARAHCEDHARRDLPDATFDWIEDEEDGVAELVATVDGEERPTGYVVTALEVAAEYDADADE